MIDRKKFFDEIRPLLGGRLNQAQVDVIDSICDSWERVFVDCNRTAAECLVTASDNFQRPIPPPSQMDMSAEGRAILIQREGCRLNAYLDTVGVWTIGVGHTSAAGPPSVHSGMKITQTEADDIFAKDSQKFQGYVREAVTVPLTSNQFDALCSFVYNVGPTAFNSSTMLKCINRGDMDAAFEQFSQWRKPPEIIPRRRAEACQFQYNVAVQTIPNGDPLLQQYKGLNW
jgi:lysozyme